MAESGAESGTPITPTRFDPPDSRPAKATSALRPGMILAGIGGLAGIVLVWWLLTAQAVRLEVTPTHSTIDIHGGLSLKVAGRYLLRANEYEVLIAAEGYFPLTQPLVVTTEPNQRHAYSLEPLPGHLRVDTGPVTGARVFVDDDAHDTTPTVIREIPAGEHRLRVEADNYFPFEERITIEGLDREQSLNVTLIPAWAEVSFSTEPVGAEVFIDEELRGQTPLTTAIAQGRHAARVALSGFKAWQEEIDVTANVAQGFTDIRLQPADAVVVLASNPSRANVTVDGQYQGLTPLEVALTPGRNSTIRLFRQGYQPASRELNVRSGSRQDLHVALVPDLVSVEFRVTPPDAELFINGKTYGAAPQTVQLPASSHQVEIRREGYIDYQSTITPLSGMAQQFDIRLKSLQQARQEQIKPLITTSAGQSLKLFYPSGFTMGASRREPGRRANETIRNIELTRPFYLGLHEVTNEQYRKFVPDHSSGTMKGGSLDGPQQPVVRITWEQAASYSNWLSRQESLEPYYIEQGQAIVGSNPRANGYRLPAEAEWAWAARVTADRTLLKYPWGAAMPPPANSGNYADESAVGLLGSIIPGYKDGQMLSAPVGSYPAGNNGLFDMGGNVAEWVHDFYGITSSNSNVTETDPRGPEQGEFHVIRGSSWAHGTLTELRLSYRDYATSAREDVGFRLARNLE